MSKNSDSKNSDSKNSVESELQFYLEDNNLIVSGMYIDDYARVYPKLAPYKTATQYIIPLDNLDINIIRDLLFLSTIKEQIYYKPQKTSNPTIYYTPHPRVLDLFRPQFLEYIKTIDVETFSQLVEELETFHLQRNEDNYKYLSQEFRDKIRDSDLEEMLREEFYLLYIKDLTVFWNQHLKVIDTNIKKGTYIIESDLDEEVPDAAITGFIYGTEEVPYYGPAITKMGDNRYLVRRSNSD